MKELDENLHKLKQGSDFPTHLETPMIASSLPNSLGL